MLEAHLLKLRARSPISEAEEQAIRAAVSEVREYAEDRIFVRAGQELDHSTMLLDGIVGRFKDIRSGQRQITALHVAGDFVDLHSFTLKHLDHDLIALTPCRVALVPHAALTKLTEDFPHLTRVYWFTTNLDAAIHREWEVSLGRRSAIARMAGLFCELQLRLKVVGLADGMSYALDVTQQELSECLGMTPVHANRVLQDLRRQKLADFTGGRVIIHDLRALRELADFDPAYLYLDPIAL